MVFSAYRTEIRNMPAKHMFLALSVCINLRTRATAYAKKWRLNKSVASGLVLNVGLGLALLGVLRSENLVTTYIVRRIPLSGEKTDEGVVICYCPAKRTNIAKAERKMSQF